MDSLTTILNAKRIVLKIGSALLVDPINGGLRKNWLKQLSQDIAFLHNKKIDIAIVSSGSIALGRQVLGLLPDKPILLEQSQAAAAVGQIQLARAYEEALEPHGIICAQILLTLDDSNNRKRYLNSRATLETLIGLNIIPVCNENDTVATEEIRFGDNDRLAAQVAVMTNADVLILLSDIDGLYDKDPNKHLDAIRLNTVEKISPAIEAMAGTANSSMSKGGMQTKLEAARTATSAGCAMVISNGRNPRPIDHLLSGANCTWFRPVGDPQTARKHWIGSMKPKGFVIIDPGASKALKSGKSLLPAGVIEVNGSFGRGDVIEIIDNAGEKLCKGLSRYTWQECQVIKGHKSSEISQLLGSPSRSALIHRDDMSR